MYTKGCIDEKYLFISRAKEKRLREAVNGAKDFLSEKGQKSLEDYNDNN
jgi:hypothetical protein